MQLERRHLVQLAAVARHQSVTQAAAELAITQPALSRSIQEIERLIGVRCFDRLSHGVVPTPACLALLERASELLASFEELEREAQKLAGSFSGSLAVGLGPAVAAGNAMVDVGLLIARHPQLHVRVAVDSTVELLKRLQARDLDFLVGDLAPAAASAAALEMESLEHVARLFARDGHPVLDAERPYAESARHPIALMGAPPSGIESVRAVLRESGAEIGARWMPALQVDDATAFERLLEASDFLGGSVPHAHADALRSGALRVVPGPPIYVGRVGLARLRERTLSPAAEALWKSIAEAIRLDIAAGSELVAADAPRRMRSTRDA